MFNEVSAFRKRDRAKRNVVRMIERAQRRNRITAKRAKPDIGSLRLAFLLEGLRHG